MKLKSQFTIIISIFLAAFLCCKQIPVHTVQSDSHTFYPSSKPCVRWWWFATEIKKPDIQYQLDWLKEMNFGGVEIAWVYPLYRYQKMYAEKYNRYYPKDTTAQPWLSPEWSEMVTYARIYANSIGLSCDFTFGSAWPVAGVILTRPIPPRSMAIPPFGKHSLLPGPTRTHNG
jgi:hypothetical protein